MNLNGLNLVILVLTFRRSHSISTNKSKEYETTTTQIEEIEKMGKGLTEIPTGSTQIKLLNIAYNEVSKLEDYIFQNKSYRNVEKLDLHENKITNISMYAFRGLRRLKTVDLSYNKLTSLYPYIFEQNKRLETLDLSGNKIKFYKEFIFIVSPSLDTLILNDNSIGEVYELTFVGVKHLSNLMMDNNVLSQIHQNSFKALTDLQYLSLANTGLSRLSPKMFTKTPKVTNVQDTPLANQFNPPLTRIKEDHMEKLRQIESFVVP